MVSATQSRAVPLTPGCTESGHATPLLHHCARAGCTVCVAPEIAEDLESHFEGPVRQHCSSPPRIVIRIVARNLESSICGDRYANKRVHFAHKPSRTTLTVGPRERQGTTALQAAGRRARRARTLALHGYHLGAYASKSKCNAVSE